MPTLLHIDYSMRQDGSVTREITGIFAEEWRQANTATIESPPTTATPQAANARIDASRCRTFRDDR